MAKKRKRQRLPKNSTITYNRYNPNRQARRMGIKPEEPPKEEPKTEPKNVAAVLSQSIQQAKDIQKRIVPPGMSYGEYMDYLKGKRQQLEEKKENNAKNT